VVPLLVAAACPPISATPSAAPSVSDQDTQGYGQDVIKNPQLVLVATALEVDPTLTHRNDPSLRMWYKKYNAWNDAIGKLDALKSANQWTLPEIGRTELINLFAGRAYWHSHIRQGFVDIHNFKPMVKWLKRDVDDDEPSDLEVWHLRKTRYTFKDLGIWKKEGTLDKIYQKQQKEMGKGKGKAKARTSQRIEKNRKIEPDDSANEVEISRNKKKPSGSRTTKPIPKASSSKSLK